MRRLPFALAAPLTALAARAQQPGTPTGTSNSLPPARALGAVEARAPEPLASIAAVRALPGGRVLVNDPARRRILLFDSTLATYTVVADTTSATGHAYGSPFGGLVPYRGDSTLFVDPSALSMLVIDPAGKLGRTMAVPRSHDATAIAGNGLGVPGFDAHGRLVYHGQPKFQLLGSPGAGPRAPVFPDSLPLVRVDLATRKLDTVAFVRVAFGKHTVTQDANGRESVTTLQNPLPVVDDWAVLSDGTIMILRGQDFHADLVGTDGKLRSAPKMPHDWQRMNDEQKVAFLDSTKAAMEKARAEMQARLAAGTVSGAGGGTPGGAAGGSAPAGGAGAGMTIVISTSRDDGPPARNGEPPPRGGAPAVTMSVPPITFVPASELPDYKPAFARGGARADADGHVWVRLIATKPMPGPVYDVIDGQGRLVDRVVLPPNSAVAGFGPGGVVYLGVRDSAGVHLQRARMR